MAAKVDMVKSWTAELEQMGRGRQSGSSRSPQRPTPRRRLIRPPPPPPITPPPQLSLPDPPPRRFRIVGIVPNIGR